MISQRTVPSLIDMKIVSFCTVVLFGIGAGVQFGSTGEAPSIERLVPELDQIVPKAAQVERVATALGFKWTEGPVWIHAGYLLFAEIPSNSIRKWSPGDGVSIFMQPSGYSGTAPYGGPEPGSNGMTLDAHGRLTVAGHAKRNVWRLESMNPRGEITVLADSYNGKRLNSPNDLVYRKDGSVYFTDPPYGLPTQSDRDPSKELPFNGVYRIPAALQHKPGAPPDRQNLQLVIKDLPHPNGIAFSPDQRYLYVDNSEPQKLWMRYRVEPDGSLDAGAVFFDDSSDTAPGGPDGMKVDQNGNVYSAAPSSVWIFSPEGKHLGTIHMHVMVGNVAWGDEDGKTLYITASANVYRVRLNIPGVRP